MTVVIVEELPKACLRTGSRTFQQFSGSVIVVLHLEKCWLNRRQVVFAKVRADAVLMAGRDQVVRSGSAMV